jgi:hypothetical protein
MFKDDVRIRIFFFDKFTFTVLGTNAIIHTKSINQPIFLLLSFLFFSFKFMPKKLGGAIVARWIILYVVSRYRLCYVVPYHTVLWINHLFQNGRALLKCRIFILLQIYHFKKHFPSEICFYTSCKKTLHKFWLHFNTFSRFLEMYSKLMANKE